MISDFKDVKWYENFFSGSALELWRRAIPHEITEQEVQFLQETLNLTPGSKLLDTPCGNGRLSLPLSLLGYKVTGIDLCTEYLEEGRSKAQSYETDIEFIQCDMRRFVAPDRFDGAFCMGNSFGYFEKPDSILFLRCICKSLKKGARFLLDTSMSAESFLVNGGEREWVRAGDMYMLVDNHYDCRHSRVESIYTFIQNGKEERRTAIHWLYTSGEICRMLEEAGFSVQHLYSSLEGDMFKLGDERLLVLAERSS